MYSFVFPDNFGLETKKSIIHPRSDSSNRSTRFSVSSEKSYGNGSQSRPSILNDDIEKRVLVNKDGSLSVEMRVRFRLQNEETIQWFTQIKKSPSLTNDCCPLGQTQPHYLQQSQSESSSDPDSTAYEGMDYSSQPLISALAEKQCPCCFQSQNNQFDLWENSTKKHHPVPPTHMPNQTMVRHTRSSSSSSSCNSRRMVRCRARLSRSPGGSGSERGQFVQKEMSVTEQVEHRVEVDQDGDTQVEVCKVSRCCSRTEVVAMDTDLLPQSTKIVEGELMIEQDENRPLSAVSSSSHVLQLLKEDQDDDDDLPPSASQCSNRTERPPSPTLVAHLDKEPASNISDNSVCSVKHKDHKENGETESRVSFAASTCHCGAADESDRVSSSRSNIRKPRSEEEGAADIEIEDINRAASGLARHTGRSESSQKSWASDVCSNCGGWRIGPVFAVPNPLEVRAPSVISTISNPNSKGIDEARPPSSTSSTSRRSNKTDKSNSKGISGATAEKDKERSPSTTSDQCNQFPMSTKSKCTAEAVVIKLREDGEEEATAERTASSLSDKSCALVKFQKTNCPSSTKEALLSDEVVAEEGDKEKRAPSMLSVRSNASAKSGKTESLLSNKSTKSNVSAKSGTSHGSAYSSQHGKVFPPSLKMADNAEEIESKNTEEVTQSRPESMASNTSKSDTRASARSDKSAKSPINTEVEESQSAISNRSHSSTKSSKSHKSNHTHRSSNQHDSDVTMTKTDGDEKENKIDLESVMSVKSKTSVKSGASHKSNSSSNFTSPNIAIIKAPESPAEEENDTKERTSSVASAKSSAALHNPSNNRMADIVVIETVEAGENVNNSAPGCKSTEDSHGQSLSPRRRPSSRTQLPKSASPKRSQPQQLLPKPGGGELKLDSTVSSKGKFKCCCGAVSALEQEDERKGENQEDKTYDGASERASSILSSKRQRKTSGSTEIPLSRNSSGSISLGLQEDQETGGSDSGKSGVSFHYQTECKITGSVKTATLNVCKHPENSSAKEDARSGSTVSDGETEITAAHPPAVDIPTITTPRESNDENKESGEQTNKRAASANSVKSNGSHKSCCNCSVKAAAQTLDGKSEEKSASTGSTKNPNVDETESVKSTSTTNASKMDTRSNRTSSAISGNSTVRKKSPSRAGVKNTTKGTAGFSANADAENWDTSILPSETNKMEDIPQNKSVCSQSPGNLRPESTASAQSESRKGSTPCNVSHESVKSGFCPVKCHKTKSPTRSEDGSNRVPNCKKETSIKSSSPCPIHNPRPSSKTEAGGESSLSGGDLLRETRPVECQHSQRSKSSKTNGKPRSERSGGSQKSTNLKDREDVVELTLKCLPNKSPNEVVSDWLQSIPANSNILTLNNDLNEEEDDQESKQMVETPGQEIGATEVSPDEEQEDNNEKVGPQVEEDKKYKVDCEAEGPTLGDPVRTSPLSKNWQCSAAVMKVLLSSSPGRCRSMPEVRHLR